MKMRIDSVGYSTKPKKYFDISKRLAEASTEELPWHEACDLIGNKGHAFCVADFYDNKRQKESFKSQQIFALDFDDDCDFNKIFNDAERYGLPIALAYETFSSTGMNRFRIVFRVDEPICDIRVAEIVIDALVTIFPQCDRKCSDVSRLFLGGKGIIMKSDAYISLEVLMFSLTEFFKQQDLKHSKSKVEKFCLKHNLSRSGGFAYLNGIQTEDYYEFCEKGRKMFFNFDKAGSPVNRKSNKVKVRNFNFKILDERCELYRDFTHDHRALHHDELFGIACNLNNIEGGRRVFLNVIEQSCFDKYREKDWRYYMHYMTAQEYAPMSCDRFCPYHGECNHATNIVLTAKTNRNSVVKLRENLYCPIEEVVEDVREKLENSIETPFVGINIIKAQTAIGKTHCYIDLIKNSNKKFIVAVPTNLLKDEVYERLKNAGIGNVIKTESIQKLEELDDVIGYKVAEFNKLGAYNDLVEYIKELAKEESKEWLLKYIQPLVDYCTEGNRVIVTTHKKLLNNKSDAIREYEIIVDEDILFSAVKNTCTVSIDDVLKIQDIEKAEKLLENIKNGADDYMFMERCSAYVPYEKLVKRGIESNVNAFLSSTAVAIKNNTISCFVPPELVRHKYTVLSATANENIYKMVFPHLPVQCFKCKEAAYVGELIQDCTRSYSRRDIDSDVDFFENIQKESLDFKHIITFKKYKDKSNNCIIHFGNSEGCDFLKGQNLIVAGTPHNDEVVYKLIATSLGIRTEEKMKFLEVENENYRFWLHTYKNAKLREIQLYFIESELVQAVGRARLLRYNCKVKLYASFPLPQAIIE